MAKFLTGKDLEEAITSIIWDAEQTLMIVSPYIKLDDYFKKLFDHHIDNPKVHFLVVFGKNEKRISRSLSQDDFDYFKKFPNVSVVYVPQLHAKYYGNEKKGVITSINLYDYSFKNNIEFGVYSERNFVASLTKSADDVAWETCWKIAKENEAVFISRPVYRRNILSSFLGKSYTKSVVMHDITKKFYSPFRSRNDEFQPKKLDDFPQEVEQLPEPTKKPSREEVESTIGYCIRTGVKIPFNTERPFCDDAFRTWSQFKNPNFPEKYCHRTGKPSRGKTSLKNPIL
jgi:hypothetical protein